MGLDERLEPDLDGARDEPGEPLRRMEDGEEEHEIRAGRAEMGQLDRFDDELLGQDRDRDGSPNGPQVVDRAAEPVRLAQHGDRDRAPGLVGPRPGDDVLVAIGDVTGRWRAPLDLGDDVKAGRGEPIEDRPRRAGSGRDREVVVEGQAGHLVADVGPAAFGDLGDNVGLAPRRRCGRRRFVGLARPLEDRHAGAPSASASSSARRRLDVAAFGAQSLEQLRPEPGIDRQAGSVDPRFERVDRARDEQRRPGVEEHDVAPRAGLAAEHRLGDPGVLGGRPTGQLGRRCPPEAERGGVDLPPLDAVRRHVIEDTRSVERQLVDPIAVDHERPLGPEELGDIGDPGGRRRVAHAEELACRPGRVRQRTEQVERRADPDLAARRTGVLHRRVEPRREHEREPAPAEGLARRQRVVVDPDAERVEDVGRPRSRGDRAVAVLRHGDASGGDDERGRRRDVERAAAVAARADDIDRANGCIDPEDPLAHCRGEPGQLLDRLAAHPEGDEERRQLGRRRLAIHHGAHRRAGLVHREDPAVDDRGERRPDLLAHGTVSASGSSSASPAVANEPEAASSRDASPSPA